MSEFLLAISTFPGLLPSILVGVLLVFWLFAIVGAIDFESFGPDWIGDGAGHDADGDLMPGMLVAFGFERMPFSVVLSAIAFFWWLLSVLGAQYLLTWLPLPIWMSGSVLLVLALILGVLLASLCVRPLKPLFVMHTASVASSLVGRVCRITTQSVEPNFGQAEVRAEDGAPITVRVFASLPNALRRGSSALIIDYDGDQERFEVEAYAAASTPL